MFLMLLLLLIVYPRDPPLMFVQNLVSNGLSVVFDPRKVPLKFGQHQLIHEKLFLFNFAKLSCG